MLNVEIQPCTLFLQFAFSVTQTTHNKSFESMKTCQRAPITLELICMAVPTLQNRHLIVVEEFVSLNDARSYAGMVSQSRLVLGGRPDKEIQNTCMDRNDQITQGPLLGHELLEPSPEVKHGEGLVGERHVTGSLLIAQLGSV